MAGFVRVLLAIAVAPISAATAHADWKNNAPPPRAAPAVRAAPFAVHPSFASPGFHPAFGNPGFHPGFSNPAFHPGFTNPGFHPGFADPAFRPQQGFPGHPGFSGVRPTGIGAPRVHADFRGREFHRLAPRELAMWRGGRWHHEWHHGRFGWWWDVDGVWYSYDAPVYPYPEAISNDAVEPEPAAESRIGAGVASFAPAPQYWYHCDSPNGFYPYVRSCPSGWHPVSPTPRH